MRILFLTNLYPPHDIGGYEQLCQEVADSLGTRGHRVSVLTSRWRRDGAVDQETDVFRSLHLQADMHHYRPQDFWLMRARQERENHAELEQALAKTQPELAVVWGMWNLSRNLPYWLEQEMPGRVAYYVSSYWPEDVDIHVEYWQLPAGRPASEWIKRPIRALALRRLRREGYPPALRFQHAACSSRYVRETLVRSGKLPGAARLLYNGINPEPFLRHPDQLADLGERPLKLVYFGSLLPHKGVHTAIEAMALLCKRGFSERVTLTILGGGHPSYEAQLEGMVRDSQLGRQVRFEGRVPRDEIPGWLHRFDVFLFTSIWPEPIARTVMEAMAAHLGVIGAEVGGQTEMLIDEKTGLTFSPGDGQGLAWQIERVLEKPELLVQVAEAGQQLVLEHFTLERMVNEIEEWLESIVSRQG